MLDRPILEWPDWAASPPGRYLLGWEQTQLDHIVSDIFGYHALQLGLPQLDALHENRMPCRTLVLDAMTDADPSSTPSERSSHAIVRCDFSELPFAAQSVDLLVLPHTLEHTREPHTLLREATRVLLSEGQLVILGFNSASMWGLRHRLGHLAYHPFVPANHSLLAISRLKDWLKLLGFELSRGHFGCYRFPLNTESWLQRYTFMEAAGNRWWPIFGAVYAITAIKRVRGIRLIGATRPKKALLTPALPPVSISSNQPHPTSLQ